MRCNGSIRAVENIRPLRLRKALCGPHLWPLMRKTGCFCLFNLNYHTKHRDMTWNIFIVLPLITSTTLAQPEQPMPPLVVGNLRWHIQGRVAQHQNRQNRENRSHRSQRRRTQAHVARLHRRHRVAARGYIRKTFESRHTGLGYESRPCIEATN